MEWKKKLERKIRVLKALLALETADLVFYYLIRFFEYEVDKERIDLYELDLLRRQVLAETER